MPKAVDPNNLEEGLTDKPVRESIIINHNPDITVRKCNKKCLRNCLCAILGISFITAGNIYISYLIYNNKYDNSNSC